MRILPLSGMPLGMTQSNALMRSVATISSDRPDRKHPAPFPAEPETEADDLKQGLIRVRENKDAGETQSLFADCRLSIGKCRTRSAQSAINNQPAIRAAAPVSAKMQRRANFMPNQI